MRHLSKIFPLLLLASALSLSSCVNQVKDAPKTQAHDTLSQLQIVYDIPDSNQVLTVHFRAAMTPQWQKNYRIDWNFGDSTGIISKFDTSNLTHYFQKDGSYIVSLSVFDTISKTVLGKTSVLLHLENNPIDTNILHGFTKINIAFTCPCNYSTFGGYIWHDTTFSFSFDSKKNSLGSRWMNNHFQSSDNYINCSCFISRAGFQIDSGWCRDSSTQFGITQHTWSFKHINKYIAYNSLDRIFINSDSIVFSNSGIKLKSKMISVVDSNISAWTTSLPMWVESGYDINDILWDKLLPPILRIKFYK